jgi:hypothetical protein
MTGLGQKGSPTREQREKILHVLEHDLVRLIKSADEISEFLLSAHLSHALDRAEEAIRRLGEEHPE